ncbi:hypothetical protein TCSYLVIO_004317 [Trypanosoma cruzi]|nr:hypothetical protein TCSYLVIO_004317 [Trypanosoma cruzi]
MEYRINELGRFRILLGGLAASLCMSVIYGFNLLSNHIQNEFDLNANDLTTITTVGIVVGLVTFPGGILLDYAGPKWVLAISTVTCSLGALLFGLTFQGVIAASVLRFSVFCAFLNFGCFWFDTGSLMAVLGSFPLTRGPVVALMKTYGGIGSSVLAVLNYSFFYEKYAAYMYFLAITVVFLGGFSKIGRAVQQEHIVDREKKTLPLEIQERRKLIEPYYLQQRPPIQRFIVGCIVVISLIIYLVTQSLCLAYVSGISKNTRIGITIGAIILLFSLSVIVAPFRFLGGMSKPPNEELPPLPDELAEPVQLSSTEAADRAVKETHVPSDIDPQYQGTFWEDLKTPDLWMMWWNTFVTWSCALVISFNSAQIYRALNDNEYDTATNSMYSAIIGIGNALGRLAVGIIEFLILRRSPERRPAITCLYPVASLSLFLSVFFLLVLPLRSKAVILGFLLGGIGNGAGWASTALVMRSVYSKDIGKHYNFMYVGAFFGIIVLNRFAYGEQLTRATKKGPHYPNCGGKACIQNGFIVFLCVLATAIVASTLVHVRYTRFIKNTRAACGERNPGPIVSNDEKHPEGSSVTANN